MVAALRVRKIYALELAMLLAIETALLRYSAVIRVCRTQAEYMEAELA